MSGSPEAALGRHRNKIGSTIARLKRSVVSYAHFYDDAMSLYF